MRCVCERVRRKLRARSHKRCELPTKKKGGKEKSRRITFGKKGEGKRRVASVRTKKYSSHAASAKGGGREDGRVPISMGGRGGPFLLPSTVAEGIVTFLSFLYILSGGRGKEGECGPTSNTDFLQKEYGDSVGVRTSAKICP